MSKVINSFNFKVVLNKTYGMSLKLPFNSILYYGSSRSLYDNDNNYYETNSMNGLNLDLIHSKQAYELAKSIFDKSERKNYIKLYEKNIETNMNTIIDEFACEDSIKDINFNILIEGDTRVINEGEHIMSDTVELLTIVTVISMAKGEKTKTKTLKNMCYLGDDIEKLLNKIRVSIKSLLKDGVDIDLNGKFELIFSPKAAGILFHETIGHALEADLFMENNCFLNKFHNSRVCSEILNIQDIPLFRRFDDDGNMCNKITLIDNGKIVGLLYNEVLANANNVCVTGNGFKSRYCDITIPRMRNLRVINGMHTVEDILNSTRRGIYIESVHCGDVNIGTGEISLLIDNAYLIENGVKTHKIKDFTYYGNALEIINSINMIGNDCDYEIDKCNKRGQLITVGYGSPTIKIDMTNVMR
ncbi:TldD/PmbA family protein [Clostridium sporogenes]